MMVLASRQFAAAEVTVEHSEKGAVVKVDGKPFAEYLMRSGHQPAVWPVIGPTGKAMTRSYPAGPLLEGEMNDHPHHHSLWFTHGNVNGHDFWTNHEQSHQNTEIRHREFVATESGETGKIVTRNDWLNDGTKVLEDERTLVFGEDEFGRYIDFLVTLNATEGDVTFGETKEGSFGVRANAPLTVDSKQGAHLVNNRGHEDGNGLGHVRRLDRRLWPGRRRDSRHRHVQPSEQLSPSDAMARAHLWPAWPRIPLAKGIFRRIRASRSRDPRRSPRARSCRCVTACCCTPAIRRKPTCKRRTRDLSRNNAA